MVDECWMKKLVDLSPEAEELTQPQSGPETHRKWSSSRAIANSDVSAKFYDD
jgi:hypothetical protein